MFQFQNFSPGEISVVTPPPHHYIPKSEKGLEATSGGLKKKKPK